MLGTTPRDFTKRCLTRHPIYIIISLRKGCPNLRLGMNKVPPALQMRKLRPNEFICCSQLNGSQNFGKEKANALARSAENRLVRALPRHLEAHESLRKSCPPTYTNRSSLQLDQTQVLQNLRPGVFSGSGE